MSVIADGNGEYRGAYRRILHAGHPVLTVPDTDPGTVAEQLREHAQKGQQARATEGTGYPTVRREHLFSLCNPYPPLPKISVRLLKTFGIREPLSLELNPDWREFEDIETTWHLSTNGGPLPDLNNHGLYSRSYCEVALRRVVRSQPQRVYETIRVWIESGRYGPSDYLAS